MARDPNTARFAPPGDAPSYVLYDQIGHLLRRAHQRATAIFTGAIGEDALTPLQFAALVAVRDTQPIAQNEVGQLTAMDPATVLGVVRRLADRGLVERRTDRGDRRRRLLQLTAEGARAVERAIPRGIAISEATLAPLDADERALFLRLLKRLI